MVTQKITNTNVRPGIGAAINAFDYVRA